MAYYFGIDDKTDQFSHTHKNLPITSPSSSLMSTYNPICSELKDDICSSSPTCLP